MFRIAKEKKARLWKDYSPSGPTVDIKDKTFSGKVRNLELRNGSKKICTIDTFLHHTILMVLWIQRTYVVVKCTCYYGKMGICVQDLHSS